MIRSCWADSVNHPQAVYQMNTGSVLMGKPSLGSWVGYGLGTENQDLPAFVVLPDPAAASRAGRRPTARASCRRATRGPSMRSRPAPDPRPRAARGDVRRRRSGGRST